MRATRWTLGWVALVLSVGMFFTATQTENYNAINSFSDRRVWGCIFLSYGACQVAASLFVLPAWVRIACCVVGLWVWSYLFLSFVVYDPTPIQATELMLAVPLISEVWILAGDLFTRTEGRA
jgi:peptidoglycan/LPS O-acetylase OafA/YrhL